MYFAAENMIDNKTLTKLKGDEPSIMYSKF